MTRLKSAALTVFAFILGLAALGFFASFGLALVGALALMAGLGALAAGIAALTGPKTVAKNAAP